MKLENRAKKLLAITKSKAKMYEFGVEEKYHISLVQDPNLLLISTIGIIGELAASESRGSTENNPGILELKNQLISVSQYFDALNQSHAADELTLYLSVLGSSAYYLADMPGSSLVLANNLKYDLDELTPNYLEGLLVWLLKSDLKSSWYRYEKSPLTEDIDAFVDKFLGYFSRTNSLLEFSEKANILRKKVYSNGIDRELLFIDIIVSLAIRKINNSSINCLPKFTNLKIDSWIPALDKPSFIKEFWPAQKLLGEQGVLAGTSAVVQMPTSAGKTKSTELIIRSAFLSERAAIAVIIAPFRALCREITASFQKAFKDDHVNINELQDVTQVSESEDNFLNFLIDDLQLEQYYNKTIIVSTPEKLVYLMRQKPMLAQKIDLLIFDEGHQFDTGKRGITYELLLASLRDRVNPDAQKVLISAVMANAKSIGDWLNGESGVEIQGNQCLPTIRSVAFVSWQTKLGQLQYIDYENKAEREFFVPRVIEQINLGKRGRERKDRLFPIKKNNTSMAAYLGVKLCHQGPVAIFCGVKNTVTSICEYLVDSFKRGLSLSLPSNNSDQPELDKIAYLSRLHFGQNFIFNESIKIGILPHSSNIPNGMRFSIEWAMENNKACFVVCTSTLAQGINLPIKYLIISSTFQAGEEITTRDFHNLIGRTGRAGYHTEGSIIFSDSDIYDFRSDFQKKWKWERAFHLLNFNNAEDCVSSLKDLIKPFEFDELDLDLNSFINDPEGYRQICIESSEEYELDITTLLKQMDYKLNLIQSVESYFLYYLKDNPDVDQVFFMDLAQNTLAYFLADEDEKNIFISAFEMISNRVLSLDRQKFSYYGKTLLGVQQLIDIEDWISENKIDLELAESSDELLSICWPLILVLNRNNIMQKIQPENILLNFAKEWISGTSYGKLYNLLVEGNAYYQANTQQRSIKMDHVLALTDGALSFDAMLNIGALADVMEGNNYSESSVNKMRLLQSELKLGLSSNLDLWIYSKGYVDREVCKLLSAGLVKIGVSIDNYDLNILQQNSTLVDEILSELPTYFSSAMKT